MRRCAREWQSSTSLSHGGNAGSDVRGRAAGRVVGLLRYISRASPSGARRSSVTPRCRCRAFPRGVAVAIFPNTSLAVVTQHHISVPSSEADGNASWMRMTTVSATAREDSRDPSLDAPSLGCREDRARSEMAVRAVSRASWGRRGQRRPRSVTEIERDGEFQLDRAPKKMRTWARAPQDLSPGREAFLSGPLRPRTNLERAQGPWGSESTHCTTAVGLPLLHFSPEAVDRMATYARALAAPRADRR